MDIALAAAAALGNDLFLSFFRKVGNDLTGLEILHDRADRDTDAQVCAALAVHLAVHAVAAVFSHKLVLEPEILERRQFLGGVEDHVAALAAVTAVRTAIGDVLFRMERHHTVTTVAGLDMYFRMIDKHVFRS